MTWLINYPATSTSLICFSWHSEYIAHIALGCTERRWTSDRGARAASAGHFTSPAGTLSVTLRATSEIKIKIQKMKKNIAGTISFSLHPFPAHPHQTILLLLLRTDIWRYKKRLIGKLRHTIYNKKNKGLRHCQKCPFKSKLSQEMECQPCPKILVLKFLESCWSWRSRLLVPPTQFDNYQPEITYITFNHQFIDQPQFTPVLLAVTATGYHQVTVTIIDH